MTFAVPDQQTLLAERPWLAKYLPPPPSAVDAFVTTLHERARTADQTIVLPEGWEPRICEAAVQIRAAGIARLVLLGPQDQVEAAAAEAKLDLKDVQVIDPATSEYRSAFAEKYLELRKHKGMTPEKAAATMGDVSYFGTMMVAEGLADGMVSGAVHTTAHTIRPAFEILKTAPGVKVVSSAFFMGLSSAVYVYGDCAVNPDPDAEALADIAVSCAETAKTFGIDPVVAMLSYSTLGSGSGPNVLLVEEATRLVRERDPSLAVDGPLQYDAAADPTVAAAKAPGSPVAGKATVFIFPDLASGNIGYKAVQRSSGAVAIGPVLQGLRKPVNDLSRGAHVIDIVHTVAITAVQAAAHRP